MALGYEPVAVPSKGEPLSLSSRPTPQTEYGPHNREKLIFPAKERPSDRGTKAATLTPLITGSEELVIHCGTVSFGDTRDLIDSVDKPGFAALESSQTCFIYSLGGLDSGRQLPRGI